MNLRQQIERLLQSGKDRAALLRELQPLARHPEFGQLADVWAPALYERDPQFFESFLLNHLPSSSHPVYSILLPRVEAAGKDAFFQELFRRGVPQPQWDRELLVLAQSRLPDEQVGPAIQRRDMSRWGYTLSEETALALYRRDPAGFGDFVRRHTRRPWNRKTDFKHLREEARKRGDDDLYWHLFREFAREEEWRAHLRLLLQQDVPAERIEEELRKRLPTNHWQLDLSILVDFLDKYGAALVSFIEANVAWFSRRGSQRLLDAARRLDDESLYWRLFFKTGNVNQWNQALRELLQAPLADDELPVELQRRSPPASQGRWAWWWLASDVALALYRRNPERFRPFLERFMREVGEPLFREVEQRGDEQFLDFLSFRFMQQLSGLLYQAYPPAYSGRAQSGDKEARRQIETIGALVTARFDRLYAQSPDLYVRHAARILGYFRAFEVWSVNRERAHNPIFVYLSERAHDTWRRSPEAIRELLESPNIYVQILGLEILREGGPDAARRVMENLLALQALLLGRARRNTRRRALECLEQAARQGPEFARAILPILEETMDFHSKLAVDERIMVSFVRLRHHLRQAEQAAAR